MKENSVCQNLQRPVQIKTEEVLKEWRFLDKGQKSFENYHDQGWPILSTENVSPCHSFLGEAHLFLNLFVSTMEKTIVEHRGNDILLTLGFIFTNTIGVCATVLDTNQIHHTIVGPHTAYVTLWYKVMETLILHSSVTFKVGLYVVLVYLPYNYSFQK